MAINRVDDVGSGHSTRAQGSEASLGGGLQHSIRDLCTEPDDVAELLALAADLASAGYGLRTLQGLRPCHAWALIRVSLERGVSGTEMAERLRQIHTLAQMARKEDLVPPLGRVFEDPGVLTSQERVPREALVWRRPTGGDGEMSGGDRARLRALEGSIHRLNRAGGPVVRHATRDKSVGCKTQYERRKLFLLAARQLYEMGYRPEDVSNLRTKHVRALARHWEHQGLSAATLQTRVSHLRTLGKMLGKTCFVPPNTELFDDPRVARRTGVALSDKSWDAHEVDLESVFAQAYDHEPHVAIQLLIQLGFGLRFAEAACFHPEEADLDDRIKVIWGTKNGRPREVALWQGEQGERQRAILEMAKGYACPPEGSLIPTRYTLAKWEHRFYYVLRVCGLTRKGLGVTAHGLRHQFAAQLYEQIAGLDRPLRRVQELSEKQGAIDRKARKAVASALGHARRGISNAYLGTNTGARA